MPEALMWEVLEGAVNSVRFTSCTALFSHSLHSHEIPSSVLRSLRRRQSHHPWQSLGKPRPFRRAPLQGMASRQFRKALLGCLDGWCSRKPHRARDYEMSQEILLWAGENKPWCEMTHQFIIHPGQIVLDKHLAGQSMDCKIILTFRIAPSTFVKVCVRHLSENSSFTTFADKYRW